MKKILLVYLLFFTGISNASQIQLIAELRASNQNGSNPDVFTNLGRVPSDAGGVFQAMLDTEEMLLRNITLTVNGMRESDLRGFGPNNTPFHIHLPNNGPGTFGFNVIDLSFATDSSAFTFSGNGFTFFRDAVSILEEDQGAFFGWEYIQVMM